MSLFDWLLVAHLAGDFLLQTDGMASNKGQSWQWMIKHVAVYMAVVTPVLIIYAALHSTPGGLMAAALLFILVTHVALDRRGFTAWWMRLVGVANDKAWISVVVDQVFHILTLALVAQVLVLASK